MVFDFDGLLVDTEWSIYEMARDSFAAFGVVLDVATWATVVGRSNADECAGLCAAQGWDIDQAAWWRHYDSLDRSHRDHLPVQPGVVDLLDACAALDVPVGIASSSGRSWIEGHLDRLGLSTRFTTIAGVDRTGGVGKPAPDVYLLACADLGADPAGSVALEDSAPGLAAARAAGMATVAVPTRITAHTDLTGADLTVSSLADLDLATLAALVAAP